MYVCICNDVNDKQIKQAIKQGNDSLQKLQHCLDVATCCGQCEDTVIEILEEEVEKNLYYEA